MRKTVVWVGPEEDLGTSDDDLVAVEQGRCVDTVPLDEGAVGGTEVGGDHAGGGDAQFEVTARDTRVVNDDVGLGAAPDDGHRLGEQPFFAVDVDDGVLGGCGRGGGGCRGSPAVFGVDLEGATGFGGVGDEFDRHGAEERVAV